MKFRPPVQLRFRSEAQFEAAKSLAGASMNEWILQTIEAAYPGLNGSSVSVVKTVKAKVKLGEEELCEECSAVGGLHLRGCKRGKK